MFWAKTQTWLSQDQCDEHARQGSRDPFAKLVVMRQSATTKGLRGFTIAFEFVCESPNRRCIERAFGRARSWQAAMRLEVAARKSSFLWRRTDDVRFSVPSRQRCERQRFFRAGTMNWSCALTKPVHTRRPVPARMAALIRASFVAHLYRATN